MMNDRLFLAKGCPDCAVVVAVLDMNAVIVDEFRGRDGQGLLVYSALSNAAAKELLSKFGCKGKVAPLLVVADGTLLDKPTNIIAHLQRQGMAVKR